MRLGPLGALAAGSVVQLIGDVPLVIAVCAMIAWLVVLGSTVLVLGLRRL
jgi:hypothetical protein